MTEIFSDFLAIQIMDTKKQVALHSPKHLTLCASHVCTNIQSIPPSFLQHYTGDWVSSLSLWVSLWFAISGHSASVPSVFTLLTDCRWISLSLPALKGLITGGSCNHHGAHSSWSDEGAGCHMLCEWENMERWHDWSNVHGAFSKVFTITVMYCTKCW